MRRVVVPAFGRRRRLRASARETTGHKRPRGAMPLPHAARHLCLALFLTTLVCVPVVCGACYAVRARSGAANAAKQWRRHGRARLTPSPPHLRRWLAQARAMTASATAWRATWTAGDPCGRRSRARAAALRATASAPGTAPRPSARPPPRSAPRPPATTARGTAARRAWTAAAARAARARTGRAAPSTATAPAACAARPTYASAPPAATGEHRAPAAPLPPLSACALLPADAACARGAGA